MMFPAFHRAVRNFVILNSGGSRIMRPLPPTSRMHRASRREIGGGHRHRARRYDMAKASFGMIGWHPCPAHQASRPAPPIMEGPGLHRLAPGLPSGNNLVDSILGFSEAREWYAAAGGTENKPAILFRRADQFGR